MFVDKVTVFVKAGNGGDGLVSWRHEKFIDRGGPDGGDGGQGGDVIFEGSRNRNTLADFRHKQRLSAKDGDAGQQRRRHGKNGSTLTIAVPVGTAIFVDGQLVGEILEDGQKLRVAKGGRGGFGNAHFISSTRQAPKVAEKGESGEEYELQLELKLLADVGLVGLPNAGKSTLLSVISNARPEIADYPFTTLIPNLGVADIDNTSLLVADIPGLIEGASKGKGLGEDFLRHVERTAVLIHLVDVYSNDIAKDYKTVMQELASYEIDLSQRPMIVVLTKTEGLDKDLLKEQLTAVKKAAGKHKVMPISAQAKTGLKPLLRAARKEVEAYRAEQAKSDEEPEAGKRIHTIAMDTAWKIEPGKGTYRVVGKKIERFANQTDFDNSWGVERLKTIMRKMGIMHELERQGIKPGDKITFKGTTKHTTY